MSLYTLADTLLMLKRLCVSLILVISTLHSSYAIELTKELLGSPNYVQIMSKSIIESARKELGARYRLGSISRGQYFDCSGLIRHVYSQHGFKLPHSSWVQARFGIPVDPRKVQPADLVFFKSRSKSRIGHVGMITEVTDKEVRFIHASLGRGGVIEESVNLSRYRSIFACARRLIL